MFEEVMMFWENLTPEYRNCLKAAGTAVGGVVAGYLFGRAKAALANAWRSRHGEVCRLILARLDGAKADSVTVQSMCGGGKEYVIRVAGLKAIREVGGSHTSGLYCEKGRDYLPDLSGRDLKAVQKRLHAITKAFLDDEADKRRAESVAALTANVPAKQPEAPADDISSRIGRALVKMGTELGSREGK